MKREKVKTTKLQNEIVFDRKKVYFLDITAMIYYAGPLYGCFLVDTFESKYLIPGENNIFATDEQTLRELRKMEQTGKDKIYLGYGGFIERNFFVISKESSINAIKGENIIRKEFTGKPVVLETEPYAHTIGSLFYLYNDKNLNPILVTYDSETEVIAKEIGFEVYKTI